LEPLETDTLYLAATRPAIFMGVPLALGAIFLMLTGFIVVRIPPAAAIFFDFGISARVHSS